MSAVGYWPPSRRGYPAPPPSGGNLPLKRPMSAFHALSADTSRRHRGQGAWKAVPDPAETMLQPLPECSSGLGTRSDHEFDLGMKTLVVLKLPQAFADFGPRRRASFRIEISNNGPIGAESLLHHLERFGS
jgi:hypothetical protein